MSGTGHKPGPAPFGLVVVVSSVGGLEATSAMLGGLPREFHVPIALVHHRSLGADDLQHVELLQRRSALPVRVARHGEPALVAGVALVPAAYEASLDHHLRYDLTEASSRRSTGGDRLFSSAARLGPAVIGVVLTGKLHDGTDGVRAIKRAGGRVLAEDPRTARAPDMPSSAIATGCVDHVLPFRHMAPALVALAMAPGGAELLTVAVPAWAQMGV